MKRTRTRAVATAAVLGITLLGLAPLTADARGRRGQPPSPESATERLTQQLGLSDKQQEKVQTILAESFEQRRELRDQHRLEMDAMRETTEDRLSAVLTGDQMDDLRKLKEERRERRRDCDRRKGRWDDGGPDEDGSRGEDHPR